RTRAHVRIVLTVQFHLSRELRNGIDDRNPIFLIRPDLEHESEVDLHVRAHPGAREARPALRSLVDILDVGWRPVLTKAPEVVGEGITVSGKRPVSDQERVAVLMAGHPPGVRPLDADG